MEPFIAQIMLFGGNFAPRGWAFCDGQLLPISSNSALFSIIGTAFGGDGRTTFALPDLRGRVPMHAGTGPGLSPRRIGESIGVEDVALVASQMPSHSHEMLVASAAAANNRAADDAIGRSDIYVNNDPSDPTTQPSIVLNSRTIGSAGGSQRHENMQPTLCINYIIALQGIFPSRN
ncbi:microcystin-dependent protein [Loktanella sp. PT4BL]|jgi:microcystin-dependent protein|uniref:phage tail protein n=1 Tax=Loktanella sp. PT4BL TaxID=2135611 RepID=UPI000D765861|nr:tail fiber protein [Loktanella sp. PT4BL]PXW72740.1 microcystin-dependent protein [Loktanella sp. PT4BL]